MEQKWVVKDNGKFHIIKTTQVPRYPERYLAPPDAGPDDGDLITIIQIPIPDDPDGKTEGAAVIDPEKKLERETLVDSRNARLMEKNNQRVEAILAAKTNLDKVDLDKIKTIKELKTVVNHLIQLIRDLN